MRKRYLYSIGFLTSLFAPVMAAEDQQMFVTYRAMTDDACAGAGIEAISDELEF